MHQHFGQKKSMARSWKKKYSLSIYLERYDIRGKETGEGSSLLQETSAKALRSMTPFTTNAKETLNYNRLIHRKMSAGTEGGFYILHLESQQIYESTKSTFL